jgi:hypothetical protein
MKYGVLLLLCIGCGGRSDCVLAGAPVIVNGTGSLATDHDAFTMDQVAWTEPSAPTSTNSVSFSIAFGNGPSVECNRVPWSSLANGALVNVSQECVVIDGSNGAEAQLTDATLSVTSTIDATNEGTLTLRFDAPDQTVTLIDGDLAFTHVELDVGGLVATVSFAHAECPSSGCSSSAFDLSGV